MLHGGLVVVYQDMLLVELSGDPAALRGPAAGCAGLILSIIALMILAVSFSQSNGLPSAYRASDSPQFRQLQVTDIEFIFSAIGGVVVSTAGLLFALGPARGVALFGAGLGALSALCAAAQLWEVRSDITTS